MALLRHILHLVCSRAAFLALLAAASSHAPAIRAQDSGREYNVKAVFLYNFCQFMDWPISSFAGASDPIVIGIVGGNPFGSRLQQAVHGEVVRGRAMRIEYYQRASQATRCHLVFFSSSIPRTEELAELHRRNIATVGESNAFLANGGMIALIADQNRVRLRINLPAVRATAIEMSSKLLRVADINR